MSDEQHEIINRSLQADGGLYLCNHQYVSWNPGDEPPALDGIFTPDELRAIADHVDKLAKDQR
jgi:hypothetical protein